MRNEAGEFTTPVPEWMHRLKHLDDLVAEKDAEIERLRRELMEVRFEFDQYKTRTSFPSTGLYRERDTRPPESGVQDAGAGGGTDV